MVLITGRFLACLPVIRICLLLSSLLCLSLGELYAQVSSISDPFKGRRAVIPSNELVMTWADPDSPAVFDKLYDYVSFGNPALEDSIQAQERAALSTEYRYVEEQAIDIVVGDFDKDPEEDIIKVWEGEGGRIYAHHPGTSLLTEGALPELGWETVQPYEVKPPGTLYNELPEEHTLRLLAGQFDEDRQEELVLAYIGANGRIEADVYESLSDQLSFQYSLSLETLPVEGPSSLQRSIRFDLAIGDLNQDGIDELVLGTVRQITDSCSGSLGCWAAAYYLYEVSESGATLMGAVDAQSETNNANRWIEAIAVDIGDFNGDGQNEIASAVHVPHNGSTHRWYLNGIAWDGNELNVKYDEQFHQTNGSFGFPLSIEARDLDVSGTDELVIAGRTLEVYAADSTFQMFTKIAGGSYGVESNNRGRRTLAIGDLDGSSRMWYGDAAESVHWPEVIVGRSYTVSDDGGISVDEVAELIVFRFTPTQFNLEEIGRKADERSDRTGGRHLLLASGDFGDRGIRLGEPRFFRETEIIQPLVVLNAPPVHFDVFDNTSFDVTNCFGSGDCGFAARYTEQASQSVEITTEISGDWQIGAGIEGGLNEILGEIPVAGEAVADLLDALGVGIDFSFEGSFGKGFSDLIGSSRTITLSTQVTALEEDVVYANVLDYDVWEYPLFVRGQDAGFIAIVLPRPERDQWFTTGSPSASEYRTPHEVGNILSYPSDLNPNRQSQQVFRGSTFTLGSQTIAWDITREETNFTSSSQSTSLQLGGSVDISLPIPTLGLNLNGDYSTRTMNTHSTSVSNLQGVTVEFGQIQSNVEGKQANYSVTPFVYWEKSGALVVDYAVEPAVAGLGEVETWWQDRYGKAPDPAFNLPNRYKDAKSGSTVDDATKTRTRDLVFFPTAVLPGEEVRIQALVNNYSLLPMSASTPVRFYAGDPAAGGTPITGTAGNPDPLLPPLEPRGSAMVSADWVMPANLNESAIRIYAVIDPDNALDEIHTNNNTGWAPLVVATGVHNESDVVNHLDGPALNPNFPNPFSSSTTIAFSLDKAQDVRVRVFDVLGREVVTVVDHWMHAGDHNVVLDMSPMASGLYLYRLETEGAHQSRTMVKVD